jgi:hypothetical protein
MTAPAAFQATYSDLRFVKGRKVAIISLEMPIEHAEAFVQAFGTPNPAVETWVGIARLDLSKAKELGPDTKGIMNVGLEHHEEAQKPKRKMADIPIAQRAALLCQRQSFWRWMREERGCNGVHNEHDAADELRKWCAVSSRSEFASDPIAASEFVGIERAFDEWLNQP